MKTKLAHIFVFMNQACLYLLLKLLFEKSITLTEKIYTMENLKGFGSLSTESYLLITVTLLLTPCSC